jgi:hypothetical protein
VPGLHFVVFLSVRSKCNDILPECFDNVETGRTCPFSFALMYLQAPHMVSALPNLAL